MVVIGVWKCMCGGGAEYVGEQGKNIVAAALATA